KVGTRDEYNNKVYGTAAIKSSWDRWKPGTRPAWRMGAAYNRLWDNLECLIVEQVIEPKMLLGIVRGYDIVFSTVPAPVICRNKDHDFTYVESYIGEHKYVQVSQNEIIYNGIVNIPWHRASNIEGKTHVEYSHLQKQHIKHLIGTRGIKKPQNTNCICFPKIIRLGRYGKWRRDVLVSDAWAEAKE